MLKTKILIVDDSAVVRDGLYDILRVHSDIEISGDARNGLEAITKADELCPTNITSLSRVAATFRTHTSS